MVTWFKNGLIQLAPECVTSPRVEESSLGTESLQQHVCSHKQLPLAGNPATCHYKLVRQKLQIFGFPLLSWGQVHSCSSWHFAARELKEKSERCQPMEIWASVSGSVETWEKNSHKPNTWCLFSTRCEPVLLQSFDLLGELVVWGNKSPFGRVGGAWWEKQPQIQGVSLRFTLDMCWRLVLFDLVANEERLVCQGRSEGSKKISCSLPRALLVMEMDAA